MQLPVELTIQWHRKEQELKAHSTAHGPAGPESVCNHESIPSVLGKAQETLKWHNMPTGEYTFNLYSEMLTCALKQDIFYPLQGFLNLLILSSIALIQYSSDSALNQHFHLLFSL